MIHEKTYVANSTGATAYSHSYEIQSDSQNKSPDQLSQTPIGIIAAGTELPSLTKDLISIDDLSGIQISVTPANPGMSTVRANLLWRFTLSESVPLITQIDALAKYSHKVTDGIGADRDPIYTYRLYIWDFSGSQWFQVDTSTGIGNRTLSGSITSEISKYVSGGLSYLLIWDYEGVFTTTAPGGGGKEDDNVIVGP